MRVYLEISVHPIYDENGKLIYISVTASDVTEERNMYLNVMENDARMHKMNEAIKNYEAELRYMLEASKMQTWRISLERETLEFYDGLNTVARSFDMKQMQKIFVDQENEFVKALSNPSEALKKPLVYIGQMHPMVTQTTTESQWVQINCIPEYDANGKLLGAFGVWRNINDLMHKQDLLRMETQRARESGQLKSLFLANMTHEIRTPLNAIVGFSDILQMVETQEERREFIRIIRNNCDMLLRLINDILEASSMGQSLAIKPEELDLSQAFNDICQILEQRVQEPGIEFIKDNPYDSYPAYLDRGRLQQVLTNFVTNAVKYTKQGHIKVGYREKDGGLLFYCEDTGTGIPKDKQAQVFERFIKLNDFVQGTGLGLSICKSICERCGGKIGVESEGEGHGSTFWMWTPRRISPYRTVRTVGNH
jgi:signal transduction histidine kinase